MLDAWRGASQWATTKEFQMACMTRSAFQEKGFDYLIEHPFSNIYVPLHMFGGEP